mgnify:CR=1 FL=1|jgi:transposase
MKSRQIVFDIHRLKDEGYSTRAIARMLGIGRNTVVRYLKRPDASPTPKKRISKLDPYKEQIKNYLKKDPTVGATVIFVRIKQMGYIGQLTILRKYLREQRGQIKHKQAFIRFESRPGEQIQIDWGHFGSFAYGDTKRKLYALVVIESYSRMLYVEFTHSQNQQALHGCLINAFKAFGGTPKTIVVDNMLTAVTERESRLIRFNDAFLDFLRPFHITPRACNPGSPYEKGKVESAVKYLRRNFFPLGEFKDLGDIQHKVSGWLDQVANTRVHQTTGEIPTERFKKVMLRLLPDLMPEPVESYTLTVHKDFAVKFDTNSYTTPPWTIGKKLTIKADQHRVWIYHRDKQICSYPRCWQRKQRIETQAHVEQVKKLQRKNWETKEIAYFASLGEEFREYLQQLPKSNQSLKKQVILLLSFKDQYGTQSLSWAILKALKHHAYGADYIENILNQEMIPITQHPPVKLKNEALNRIRLSEPTLNDYDAIALKRRKR